ncbi:MAG TPA: PEGA domain-containing protein [Burkholderiales bacterium]
MPDRSNRTFICSVAFLDIAEYSKRPVAEQIRLKDRFNKVLQEAIRDVPVSDRIILDTGDGAALSFLGDPEDALFVTAAIRDATAGPAPEGAAPLPIRLGINVGPVRLVKDLNGQPNIIGDGINVAQRVMGFAEPGQILVSRSYYEVVSRLSEGYAQLFRYEGSRTDKHVRAHDVYTFGHPAFGPGKLRSRTGADGEPPAAASSARHAARGHWFLLGVSVVAILSGAVAIRILKQHWQEAPASQASAPASKAASPAPPAGAPARKPPVPGSQAAEAAPADRAPRAETMAPAADAQRPRPPRVARKAEPAEPLPAVPVGSAQVSLAVLPWGEIYVNGKFQGVSPPLRMVEVPPGRHTFELRNTSFPPYSEVIDLKADDKVRIRHRFAQEAQP